MRRGGLAVKNLTDSIPEGFDGAGLDCAAGRAGLGGGVGGERLPLLVGSPGLTIADDILSLAVVDLPSDILSLGVCWFFPRPGFAVSGCSASYNSFLRFKSQVVGGRGGIVF